MSAEWNGEKIPRLAWLEVFRSARIYYQSLTDEEMRQLWETNLHHLERFGYIINIKELKDRKWRVNEILTPAFYQTITKTLWPKDMEVDLYLDMREGVIYYGHPKDDLFLIVKQGYLDKDKYIKSEEESLSSSHGLFLLSE